MKGESMRRAFVDSLLPRCAFRFSKLARVDLASKPADPRRGARNNQEKDLIYPNERLATRRKEGI